MPFLQAEFMVFAGSSRDPAFDADVDVPDCTVSTVHGVTVTSGVLLIEWVIGNASQDVMETVPVCASLVSSTVGGILDGATVELLLKLSKADAVFIASEFALLRVGSASAPSNKSVEDDATA